MNLDSDVLGAVFALAVGVVVFGLFWAFTTVVNLYNDTRIRRMSRLHRRR